MSEIKALDKLRNSSHLDDDKWTLETGDIVTVFGSRPNDPNAVNWGERWRKIADEIEAEIADNYMLRPVDADGVQVRVGDTVSPYLEDVSYVVERISLYKWGWRVTADGVDADGGKCTISVSANSLRHVKPRTLEDVLNDRINDVLHVMTSGIGIALETALNDSFGEECADEIRELLGGDAE